MSTYKKVFHPLLILAIPLALNGLAQSGVFFFETAFLARLGSEILAAGALVSWLFGTFACILFGILTSISILVSHKAGAKDENGIALVFRDGLWLSIILSIPSCFLFWNMADLFLWTGQSPSVVMLSSAYLHALTWGLLPSFMMTALLDAVVGLGHAKVILKFSLLSVSLNIFFSFVLIFGKWGFPSLGIAGAGFGTSISAWLSLFLLMFYLFFNKSYRLYFKYLFTWIKPNHTVELLRVGFPMGMMYGVEVGFFFVLTLMMGALGPALLAANQIAMQYLSLFMSIIFSIAQAITVRMGHLLGANDIAASKKAAYAGVSISFVFIFLVGIIYWFFPLMLISVDFDAHESKNAEIISFAINFLFVCAIFQLLEATRIALFGVLRSLKDTRFTLYISILSFWGIALPLGYFMLKYFNFGGVGLWWGMVIGTFCSVLILFARFVIKIQDYAPVADHHSA